MTDELAQAEIAAAERAMFEHISPGCGCNLSAMARAAHAAASRVRAERGFCVVPNSVLGPVPGDFVVVPREPTDEMIAAGGKAVTQPRLHVSHAASDACATACIAYRAMLAASQGDANG